MPKLFNKETGPASLRSLFQFATSMAPGPVSPLDLFIASFTTSQPTAWKAIGESLQPGYTVSDLRALLPKLDRDANYPDVSIAEIEVTEELAEALDEFKQMVESLDGKDDVLEVEILLSCILPKLSESERNQWPMIDWPRAIENVQTRVAAAVTTKAVGDAILSGLKGFFQRVTDAVEEKTSSPQQEANPEPEQQAIEFPSQAGPCIDLTERMSGAADIDGISPFQDDLQYEQLFESMARVLHRGQGQHVMLVADRGVGRSILLAEFARQAVAGTFPFLKSLRFIQFDARYTPSDQSRTRLESILGPALGAAGLVVCIEGFADLLRGEGSTSHLMPLLSLVAHARCRIIALVEPWEYEEFINQNADISEFFERIDVPEPEPATAIGILRRYADGLAHRYRVAISDEVVSSTVVLSSNYILNERLPGKALRILHRICENIEFERTQRGVSHAEVSMHQVLSTVSQITGVPEETLRGIAERTDYKQSLAAEIFGQEHAVAEVATELGLIKAGLTDPGKPASVMLFVGQTGTGKTELAKALARFYSTSKRLKTYTLGNFVESHSVSGIIGVPAGYVGHDQGGRLVNDLISDPYCVFLLDEADKAHPDVLQPFLNLFDEGWIRDQRGVQAHAQRAIFILTTNVGQRMIAEMTKQGKTTSEITARMKEALGQIKHGKSNRPVFAPEFLARLKRVVVFRPLDRSALGEITQKLIDGLSRSWKERRGKVICISTELINFIAEEAHRLNEKSDGREGGRVVRKLISDWIEAPVQRKISELPEDYRAASRIMVECTTPERPESSEENSSVGPPEVKVRFEVAIT